MRRVAYTSILLLILKATGALAQELTLPYLESVYQSTYVNPTADPDHKYSIGLPGISSLRLGAVNTGFTLNQLISQRTNETLHLSTDQLMGALGNRNYLAVNAGVDLFHFRMKAKNTFYSFHIKEHADVRFSYPKALFALALEGNAPYVGERMDFSSLNISATHYREYAINFYKAPEDSKLSYGASFKFLQGMSNVHLRNRGFYLYTDNDMYSLEAYANGSLNTSYPPSFIEGENDQEFNPAGYFTNFSNNGFGTDLGASYKVNNRLTFSASVLNLGFIRWRSNVRNYRANGTVTYEGVDFFNPPDEDNFLDSLYKLTNYEETTDNYTTWLVPQMYLTSRYKLSNRTEAGLSFYFDYYQTIRPGLTLSLSQKAGRFFQGVLTYSAMYRTFDNIGFALMFKPGPVQFYIAGENTFRTWTQLETDDFAIVAPFNAKFITIRTGINIVLKKIKSQDRLPVPNQ
ncbi:DUF5723 family protein [Cytophagaceae bacterium ABcell3]|nr:DUF5723 family protein [Cytophagaceae bacterium ABcell3]